MSDLVSVVIPAWRSEATIGGCLDALRRQTYAPFETIVVDSSPDEGTAAIVAAFPEIDFVRRRERLGPHEARNVGVARAHGDLLVFTDPDVYPAPDWLERLVAAHRETGYPVVGGALACHGERWLDHGVHFCKFSKWLPGGAGHAVDNLPSANLLTTRRTFEELGGFDDGTLFADTRFSWAARDRHPLWLEPAALAAHHHLQSFRSLLRERFARGTDYGELRADWHRQSSRRDLLLLLVSVTGLRLPRIVFLMASHARRAGLLATFLATLPVSAAGQAASLLGESVAYGRRLRGAR